MQPFEVKGFVNEALVGTVLSQLVAAGEIKGFQQCESNSALDKAGYDFIILKNDNSEIALQVKSSKAYLRDFRAAHPGIPAICVEGKTAPRLAGLLRRELGLPKPLKNEDSNNA